MRPESREGQPQGRHPRLRAGPEPGRDHPRPRLRTRRPSSSRPRTSRSRPPRSSRPSRTISGNRTDQIKAIDAGQLKNLIDKAATSLAERKLLLAAATAAKTVVPAEELEKTLQAQYAQAGGEPAFLEALKKADISIDHVKKSIQESILINKFLFGVAEAGAKVTDDDLRKAYELETVRRQDGLGTAYPRPDPGQDRTGKGCVRTKIEDVLAKAKAGEDFAELAKQYSEDPGSKDNGGLYENFPRGRMVKPFEDAAFSVPVGGLSGIVETDFGYHILKVVGRKKETRTFEEVRAELESRLKQGKQGTVVQDFVQGLKDKAKFKLIGL